MYSTRLLVDRYDIVDFDTFAATLPSAAPVAPHVAALHTGLRTGFLRNAEAHSAAAALIIGERRYCYAEIEETARRWAGRLLDVAGGRPRRVAFMAYRSETAYLAVLAILFAGAGMVPLNPKFPVERTRDMLELADVDAVIVESESLAPLAAALRGLTRVPPLLLTNGSAAGASCPVAFDSTELTTAAPLGDLPAVAADDLAYLLFTSGSTGRPKGVPISHANALSFLDFNQRRYGLTKDDRLTQTFEQTFDLSMFDLFMAWGAGAAVCAMKPIQLLSPFRFLEQNGVTMWFSVPSVAALLLKKNLLKPGCMPTLRWSLFCGEALPRATAEAWQAAAPASIVENLYGPTELTIACAAYRWDAQRSPMECAQDLVPIGQIYQGLSDLVVDAEMRPVAEGEPGELCVAGPQTFSGYWRASELTQERILLRPAADGTLQRYYRTGDLVRRLSGGYAYLGRIDHQVKISGYRIELAEIESVLRRGGCGDAVAVAWPAQQPEAIIAFVSGQADTNVLAEAARQYLPNYMNPREIRAVDAMPLNANGKVDRKALYAQI